MRPRYWGLTRFDEGLAANAIVACIEVQIDQVPTILLNFNELSGARGETRTRTSLRTTDFKSVASTNSATRAAA